MISRSKNRSTRIEMLQEISSPENRILKFTKENLNTHLPVFHVCVCECVYDICVCVYIYTNRINIIISIQVSLSSTGTSAYIFFMYM